MCLTLHQQIHFDCSMICIIVLINSSIRNRGMSTFWVQKVALKN